MGKNSKGQKQGKSTGLSVERVAEGNEVSGTSYSTTSYSETHGDVIAGFDFLKNFVSDDSMGDSQIVACLRKMAKKDSTTKIKALQDFIELVNISDADSSSYIQFWSRCYCRLTMCGDHRVRELAQNALAAVIAKSGRNFASCLKTVLPYCILSHADCVSTVALAAKSCFELSFNESRRTQAISMCSLPFFELVSSIVTETNPYLGDQSLGLDEEEVLRRDRLLSACLGGWCFVIANDRIREKANTSTASSSEKEDQERNAMFIAADEIVKSSAFMKSILKSDSQLTLAALNVWIITLSVYSPDFISRHSKLFLSTLFLSPSTNEASHHLEIGSWQSAAALFNTLPENLYWKQPQFEKMLSKQLSFMLSNGPSFFLPPPSSFFAVPNVPKLDQLSTPLLILVHHYLSTVSAESSPKFIARFMENTLTGFQKIKPFHARGQELSVFCESVFGAMNLFMIQNFGDPIVGILSDTGIKLFDISLKLESNTSATIFPHILKLFAKIADGNIKFSDILKESLSRNILNFATIADCSNHEAINLALFFNAIDVKSSLASVFIDTVAYAVESLRTLKSNHTLLLSFLCSLSPNHVESCAMEAVECSRLQSEYSRLSIEATASFDWWSEDGAAMTYVLLEWDFLLCSGEITELLNSMFKNVDSLPKLLSLIGRLPTRYKNCSQIFTNCGKLFSSHSFFEMPGEITSLLSNCESTDGFATHLVDAIANELLNPDSLNYMAHIVHESLPSDIRCPVEVLKLYLQNQSFDRSIVPTPATLSCFDKLWGKFSNNSTSHRTLLTGWVNSVLCSLFCNREPVYDRQERNAEILRELREIAIFRKENLSFLVVEVARLNITTGTLLSAPNIFVAKDAIEQWMIARRFTFPTSSDWRKIIADHAEVEKNVNALIFGLAVALLNRSGNYELVLPCVILAEIMPNNSWQFSQLLELTDELLLSEEGRMLLENFITKVFSVATFESKIALAYLMNSRHPSDALSRSLEIITSHLLTNYDEHREFDMHSLSELCNRVLRCKQKLPELLFKLLEKSAKGILCDVGSTNSTAEIIRQQLSLFANFVSALTLNNCEGLSFDEETVRCAVKAVSSFGNIFLRENEVIDLTDAKQLARMSATSNLAIFYNSCLRYAPKISNVDPIMCSLIAWIGIASNIAKAAQSLDENLRMEIARFFVSVTECACTVHVLFGTIHKFRLSASESQKREFSEFYQLQFLDSLIQLLMALWLPATVSFEKNQKSFLADKIDNRPVKDQLTFAIVSCLHKASSLDVIAHVHLDPLFCADESYLPEDIQTIIGRLTPLITDVAVDDCRVHMAIYTVLSTLHPTLSGIYLSLAGDISQQQDSDEDFVLNPPRVWVREISLLTPPVSLAIANDTWRNKPEIISGYLYTWLLVVRLTNSLPAEVRTPMINYLRKSPDFQSLLLNIFVLAPGDPKSVDPAPFDSLPQLTNSSEAVPLIGHLACYMMRELLVSFPAAVRSWLNDQPVNLRRDIVSYVSLNLSPTLRAVELSKVRQAEFDEAIKIRAMTATGELMATYSNGELRLDLTIALPDDYPLSAPTIECKQNVLSNTSKLWLRQLTAFLICQNGAVLDALLMWQKLITEKLGKWEECTICYSIFQGGNFNLPKRQCKTCKKRFHSACLFKWFESSGNVTCPLCREQFY